MAIKSPPLLDFKDGDAVTFNILTSHARYSRKEISQVIRPGAKYITIIRDPVANLESAFGYFQLAEKLGLTMYRRPFNMFLRRLDEFSQLTFSRRPYIRNGQMYDLGLNAQQQTNISYVLLKIEEFSKEFNLVLIQEYYDESLVLLKNLLCWDFDDILYIPKGVRSKRLRYNYDKSFDKNIRQWSLADSILYDYFNKTLWRKIHALGDQFYRDLEIFRRKQKEVFRTCVDVGVIDTSDRREEKFVLVTNASHFCQLLRLEDTHYWKILGQRQMIAALRRMNFTLNFK
ncbi:galactosylceramide sulfotransferase-like [Ptychodera flava]|uniref:galactosylceramide sulfotransferase-like n=1 Tax=Ptychodera flava TaxID=63121 RepID=UPI00396A40CF